MGWMCDRVVEAGGTVIADFICPTAATSAAFGATFIIWVDRIQVGGFEDTNRMFVAPDRFDLRVLAQGTPQYWAEHALALLRPAFDPAEADSTVHRTLPTVPRWSPTAHRGGSAAGRPGLHRRARYTRHWYK